MLVIVGDVVFIDDIDDGGCEWWYGEMGNDVDDGLIDWIFFYMTLTNLLSSGA